MRSIGRWRAPSAAALLALAIGLIYACRADQQPSVRPQFAEWKLVAQSDLILQGKLMVPAKELQAALVSKQFSYVDVRARITRALKGTVASPTVQIRYYTPPDACEPTLRNLLDLSGKEALLFLLGDDGAAGLCFAGYTPKALQPSAPAIVKAVRDEVENQRRIMAGYRGPTAAEPHSHRQQVKALINQMLSPQTESAAFDELERMGPAAVPSLIRLMDDRRPLPIQEIDLVNKSPQAFEGVRHYGPKLVVDAIAALLNQITEEDFGSICNGGSEDERAKTVAGWRIYLHYQLGKTVRASSTRSEFARVCQASQPLHRPTAPTPHSSGFASPPRCRASEHRG